MDTESIDLRQIFQIVRKRLWLIILLAFLTTSLAGLYTFFWVEPVYKADVLVYIWQSTEEGTDSGNLNTSDLALFSQLVNDYEQLAKSRLVTGTVADELGLDDTQATKLAGQISVSTKQNTRLLLLTVQSTDPQFAASAANKLAQVFSDVVIEKMNVGSVNLIDEAVVPQNPVSPNKTMNLAIGLVLGVMIGVGLVFLIEMLDTRVRTADQVAAITNYPLLGVIPEFDHEIPNNKHRHPDTHAVNSRLQQDLVTAHDPLSKVSEAYKMARTNLEFSLIDEPAKVISVTSTHQGEGKTVTLTNLAVAYAHAGRRVLIIDVDLRRPAVHRQFGLSNRRGLTNALISQNGYEAFLQKSGIEGLAILASGPIPPNPAEVVLSERLHQLIETARQEFDIVLIDSPPIGVVTDSAIIANRADGVVLVVRSGEVDRRELQRAVDQLSQVKARVLGYILNGITEKHQDYYYYYEYYQQGTMDKRGGPSIKSNSRRRGKKNNTVSPITPSGPDIPIRTNDTGPGPVRHAELTLDERGHLRVPNFSDESSDHSARSSRYDAG